MPIFADKDGRVIVGQIFFALILCTNLVSAQQTISTKAIIEQEWFRRLPQQVRIPATSAVKLAKDSRYQESIQTFETVLAMKEAQKANKMFRAWIHQWLAYSYSVLDSVETARKHVGFSLKADIDIWPDNLDKSMHSDVWNLYRECYAEILERLLRKRQSFRLGVGTIMRAEYSYRFAPHFDIAAGVGLPVLVGVKPETGVEFKRVEQTHFYFRLQRMRKHIKRLTGGFYLEYALVHEYSEEDDDPLSVISAGPILSFCQPEGWEYGGIFSIAQLGIAAGDKISFSSIAIKESKTVLQYANFEVYLRKWF
ncbi:MAG: hypothetical protein ACREOO_24660 [bacterium]